MRKFLLAFTALFLGFFAFSQDFSNKGKDFWITSGYHYAMFSGPQPVMTLSLTSDVNTTYSVEAYGVGVFATGNIIAHQVTNVNIPSTYYTTGNGIYNGKAIHITSAQPIVVYSFITQSLASAATLCLPTTVLGKQYYSASYTQVSNTSNSNNFITIVAVEDNTTVEIIPTQSTAGGWAPNSVNTINLNKGQIYQVLGSISGLNGSDLTGTSIRSIASGTGSCKRIAVFSGSGRVLIGATCTNGADNLYQQLYPAASWGRKYLTVPSANKPLNYYRILRPVATANVTLNGTPIPAGSFTNNFYEFSNSIPNMIEADTSICVVQYFTSSGCVNGDPTINPNPYDPDMVVLNPVEQNISNVTLISSDRLSHASTPQHHIHVIMRNGGTGISSFKFDGGPIPPTAAWVVHPSDPAYSYLYLKNVSETYHSLQSDSGFNALAYGYATSETYAYSAGTNVKDLYQQISVQTQYGIENTPSVCTGTPFRFKISLPYKPTQLLWDLTGLPGSPANVTQLPAPGTCISTCLTPAEAIQYVCPDSCTFVNGKQIFWYSLPTQYNVSTIGSYPVKITAQTNGTDGCGSEQEINFDLNVSDPPVANFTFVQPGCAAEVVQFTDATTSVKPVYHWYYDFGDGSPVSNLQNPTHTYAAGDYTIRYSSITTPGCLSDTLEKQIHVPANPAATISGTTSVCQNTPSPAVTITGTGGVTPYIFTYNINGGPAQTITSDAAGVAVINAPTTATGTFTYNLTGVRNSTSTVCTTNIAAGTQAAVINVSTLPTATITGTSSVCQNGTAPTVTFTGANGTAPYTFSYTIDNGSGPGAVQTVISNAAGVATVSAPATAAGTFTYTITGVSYGGPTGCTTPVTGQTAVINVKPLPSGTITTTTAEVCLNAAGTVVTFTGSGGTAPYTFSYTVNSGAVQTITSTGSTVTLPVVTSAAGAFIYNLTGVQESSGCINTTVTSSATVTVNPQPTAGFTATGPYCKDQTVTLTPSGSVSTGSITSWVWDYGDGTGTHTLTTNTPFTVTYSTPGIKTVTLHTVSDKNCESTVATQTFTVNVGPVASFTMAESCAGDVAQFTSTSTIDPPGSITGYVWTFSDPNATPGNPNSGTGPTQTHTYTVAGTYLVRLIATSNMGCADILNQNITINGTPVADYTLSQTSACAIDQITLTNKSTVSFGALSRVEVYWDYTNTPTVFTTDNTPVFDETYNHTYPSLTTDRTYTVKLRAYSGSACFTDKDLTVTIHATPQVQFTAIPDACISGGTVQLTQASETAGVAGTGVYTGTGVSSTGLFDPAVSGAGTFTLTYTYTSAFGCIATATQTIKVPVSPTAAFTAGPSCAANVITFTQTSTAGGSAIAQWIWNFGGADEVHTNGDPATHTFATAGTYPVTLTVIGVDGCKNTASQSIVVSNNPVPAFTIGAPACLPAALITFTNTTPNASDNSYSWYFQYPALTPTSSGVNAQYTYTAAGPYTVRLKATNVLTGCTGTSDQVVNNIHTAPEAKFDFSKTAICTGQTVSVFNAGSTGGDGTISTYTWDYGDATPTATGPAPAPHTYASPNTYNVKLTIENSFGCKDDSVRKFTVYPFPTVDAGDQLFVLEGGSTVLQPAVTGNGLQYLWTASTSSTYLNSTIIKNPESRPLKDVTYTLLVTSDGGCTATDNVFVKILKFPEIPNTFTPNNDGIHDYWDIQYLYTYPNNRVQVFTKTGQLVFESKGYTKPWDGTMKGKPLPIDTYYYIIEPGYGRIPLTGYVTILK